MSNPDILTSISALLPNPAATIVAIIDDQYLFVDCSQRPRFADWIVTPAHMNHWMQWLCRPTQDLRIRA